MNNRYRRESTEDLQKRLRELQEETNNIKEEIDRRTRSKLHHLEEQIRQLNIRETESSPYLSSSTNISNSPFKHAGKEIIRADNGVLSREYVLKNKLSRELQKSKIINKAEIKTEETRENRLKTKGDSANRGWTLKRVVLNGNSNPVLLHILNTGVETKDNFHHNKKKSSYHFIEFGVTTGKLDRNGTEIVSGTKIVLVTPSARDSPFYNTGQAIVIGTSHHTRRIWLGHIDNLEIRTDREAKNIIAPIPYQE